MHPLLHDSGAQSETMQLEIGFEQNMRLSPERNFICEDFGRDSSEADLAAN